MTAENERDEDIEYWWSGGFPGAFAADYFRVPVQPKLYRAFQRVLRAMPSEDFDRFVGLQPTIVCQPVVTGAVYRYVIPVWPPKADMVCLWVLYFRPNLQRLSEESLVRLVAHEVAHLILGHADQGGYTVGTGDVHAEEAADRKAEAWGFKGAYSREHRRRLARRHEEAKQKRARNGLNDS